MAANTEKSSDSDVAMDADGDPTYVPDSSSSDSEASVSYPMLVAARVSADDACTDPAGENCAHAVPACEDGKHSDIKGLTYSETITVGERTVPKPQKHVCLFCHKPQSRLSRHLGSQHGGEKALVPYLNARKGDEKKRELAKLRNAGDHQHNIGVLRNKEGTMVVKRRKRQDCTVDIDNFVTCPNCFGLFQKKDLYRHKCAEAQREHGPRRELARRGKLLLPVDGDEQDSERFLSFLHTMHGDHISIVAKNDRLIRALAKRQVKRHGFDKDRFGHIRNKVRELARLLLKLREVSRLPNGTLKDFLKPGMFGAIVESTKQVAGYCENEYIFKTPSLASKLGHSLKTCAEMLEAEGIENKDEQLVEDVRGYLKLHQMRWNEEISAHASRSLTHLKKSQGVKRIPLTKDVATLATHLNNLASESSKNLQKAIESKEIKEAWNSLSEITLTQIILFNRRRSGEASKLKLEDLNQQPTHDSDVLESLSDFEKKLCKRLSRIEIFGKRGRLVPILLAGKLKAALDLLVEKREAAGISPLNKFVFACPYFQSEGHLRGSDVLRKFVGSAHLVEPQLITSTSLRKQVATLSQLVSLKDNELDILAQHMGHDVRIHREVYRLPLDTMQLAKVSKLLLALEKGKLQDHQHCSLDDMEVADDEVVTTDDEAETGTSSENPNRPAASGKRCSASTSRVPSSAGMPAFVASCHASRTQPVTDSEDNSSDEELLLRHSHAPVGTNRVNRTVESSSNPRQKWSTAEVQAVERHLSKYIMTGTLPGKKDIIDCLEAEKALEGRTWHLVKNYIRNRITAGKRQAKAK